MSYHIVSYRIISYHIISYHIISYHIISYHIISYHIISYHIISYHIISYHIISYHIISYHIISYHIISYHIISYRIISHCAICIYASQNSSSPVVSRSIMSPWSLSFLAEINELAEYFQAERVLAMGLPEVIPETSGRIQKGGSTLGFLNLHHRSIGIQSWVVYFFGSS